MKMRTPIKITAIHSPEVSRRKIEREQGMKLPHPKEFEIPFSVAWRASQTVIDSIRAVAKYDGTVSVAGSIRRERPIIHDIDILISPPSDSVRTFIRTLGEVLADGPHKITVLIPTEDFCDIGTIPRGVSYIQFDFRFIPKESWGPALQYFTGSREHNISMRRKAKQLGLRLNENGLFTLSDGERIDNGNEGDIYERLGLRWLPPRYREGYIGSYEREQKTIEEHGFCASCGRKHHRPYSTCDCCFECIYFLEQKYHAA